MRTILVDPLRPEPETLAQAASILRAGGLVVFPTETVYGLGANALDEAAVARIFRAKGRPSYNPLIAHVPSVAEAREIAAVWPDAAERLAARFWPGPLTLVVAKRAGVPDLLTAGMPSVALRVPRHPVARALLEAAGVPVAAPSANRFTELSPTTARHVEKALGDRVDLILDAGPTQVGIESTVVDVSGASPVLLRPGSLPRSAIEEVVGPLGTPEKLTGSAPRPSPGMVNRHYSPRARLLLCERAGADEMEAALADADRRGLRTGAVLLHPRPLPVTHPRHMPGDPAGYARELYAALHELDDLGCELVVVEGLPTGPEWAGIRDRLSRAASED